MAALSFYREAAVQLSRSVNIKRTLKEIREQAKQEARIYGPEAEPIFRAAAEMLKLESGLEDGPPNPNGNQWKIVHPAEREPEPKEHERSAFNARIQPYRNSKSK